MKEPLEPNFELVHPEKQRGRKAKRAKKKTRGKRRLGLVLGALLVLTAAGGGYYYLYGMPTSLQFWQTPVAEVSEEGEAEAEAAEEEAEQEPAALETYSNEAAGFSFQYPAAWGELTVSTEPFAQGESGEFLFGMFSEAELVRFGGPAFGYNVLPRGGSYLDLTGYVRGEDGFYTLYTSGALDPQPIEGVEPDTFELIAGENTSSLMYVSPESEILEPAVIGLVNLEGPSYPGLSFVIPLGEDEAMAVAEMRELLGSLKLLKAE